MVCIRGSTFIELVLVLVLVGILAFFFIPRDYFSSFNLEAAAAKVEQDIRYVREMANVSDANCGIEFLAGGSYTAYQGSSATPLTNPLTRTPFVTDIGSLFKTVQIQNSVQIEFNPLGTPVTGGGGIVQIGNGSATITLQITPNTGVIERQ